MNSSLSRMSVGWIIWTIFLIALAIGLVFKPPPAVQDGEAGAWPRFDVQARLWGKVDDDGGHDARAAVRAALEAGATTLVIDVAADGDGVAVLADGTPSITLSELLTIAESAGDGALRYTLDVAATPEHGDEAVAAGARAVLTAVAAAEIAERATIRALDWRVLEEVRESAPEVARAYRTSEREGRDTVRRGEEGASPWLGGWNVDAFGASLPRTAAAAASGDAVTMTQFRPWGAVWAPDYRDLREPDFRKAQSLGLKVVVWTVNDPEVMALLLHLGVDGMETDDPARLREVMKDKEHPLPDRIIGQGES